MPSELAKRRRERVELIEKELLLSPRLNQRDAALLMELVGLAKEAEPTLAFVRNPEPPAFPTVRFG